VKIASYLVTIICSLLGMGYIALRTAGPLQGNVFWIVIALMFVVYGSFLGLHREIHGVD
jgi:hypothetical protein